MIKIFCKIYFLEWQIAIIVPLVMFYSKPQVF